MSQIVKVCLAIVVMGFFYSAFDLYTFLTETLPATRARREQVQTELGQKVAELNRLRDFVQNVDTIKQELRELNLRFESTLESMPRSFNLSGLLRKLTLLAQNSGVELTNFKPRFNNNKVTDASGAAIPKKFYETLSIDCSLRGSFTQTLVFFDQISRLKRIVNLESLKFQIADRTKGQRSALIVAETEAILQTYRFSD